MMGCSRLPMSPEKTIFLVSFPSVSHSSALAEPSRWPMSVNRIFRPDPLRHVHLLSVLAGDHMAEGLLHVGHSVKGFHRLPAGPLALLVLPLGVALLDVGGVP